MTANVFCEQCGAAVAATARFCTECGAEQATAPVPDAVDDPVSRSSADEPAAEPAGAPAPAAVAVFAAPGPDPAAALPEISGLPLELWLVIAAFGIPGGWIVFEVVKALPDAIKALGSEFLGFRIGLALTLILLIVGLVGAAMVAIAWKLYHRDRVGRGLAYAFGGTIIISVLFSSERTSAETWAMILSLAGIAILAFAPRVRALFDQSASLDGAPTSVIVSRTLITIFCAIAIFVAVIYLLLASVSGKYVLAAIVAGGSAALSAHWSKQLSHGNRGARQALSIGGAGVALLLIITGRSTVGLLVPLGLIVSAIGCLWLPSDARVFFGDQPLNISTS